MSAEGSFVIGSVDGETLGIISALIRCLDPGAERVTDTSLRRAAEIFSGSAHRGITLKTLFAVARSVDYRQSCSDTSGRFQKLAEELIVNAERPKRMRSTIYGRVHKSFSVALSGEANTDSTNQCLPEIVPLPLSYLGCSLPPMRSDASNPSSLPEASSPHSIPFSDERLLITIVTVNTRAGIHSTIEYPTTTATAATTEARNGTNRKLAGLVQALPSSLPEASLPHSIPFSEERLLTTFVTVNTKAGSDPTVKYPRTDASAAAHDALNGANSELAGLVQALHSSLPEASLPHSIMFLEEQLPINNASVNTSVDSRCIEISTRAASAAMIEAKNSANGELAGLVQALVRSFQPLGRATDETLRSVESALLHRRHPGTSFAELKKLASTADYWLGKAETKYQSEAAHVIISQMPKRKRRKAEPPSGIRVLSDMHSA
jgi:hypothetical protein